MLVFVSNKNLSRNGEDARSTRKLSFVERAGEPVLDDGATPIQTKKLSKPAPAETCVVSYSAFKLYVKKNQVLWGGRPARPEYTI